MASRKHTTPAVQLDFSFTEPEAWRPVLGYEGLYEISNLGQVRGLDRHRRGRNAHWQRHRGRVLKLSGPRYPRVCLSKEERETGYSVHVLVLEAFVGKRPDGFVAHHRDGNIKNNAVTNLAWVTQEENIRYKHVHGTMAQGVKHPRARLTEAQVREIRRLYEAGMSFYRLAKVFGVSETAVMCVARRLSWKHIQ